MPATPLVALVDDNPSVRESLRDLLASLGYGVLVFASAAQFLATATSPDCLILDVRMPEITGPELQLRLRALGNKTPIVFITSDTDEKLRASVLAAGAVEYLIKPFDDDVLIRAIEKALGTAHDL